MHYCQPPPPLVELRPLSDKSSATSSNSCRMSTISLHRRGVASTTMFRFWAARRRSGANFGTFRRQSGDRAPNKRRATRKTRIPDLRPHLPASTAATPRTSSATGIGDPGSATSPKLLEAARSAASAAHAVAAAATAASSAASAPGGCAASAAPASAAGADAAAAGVSSAGVSATSPWRARCRTGRGRGRGRAGAWGRWT